MDKINTGNASGGEVKSCNEPRRTTITPAVLGVASSHGMKLALNMTSQDKKELLCKLEEWRKARREKLAARILSKQKQVEKPKGTPIFPVKNKQSGTSGFPVDSTAKKTCSKETVFERLYKYSNKIKKQGGDLMPPQLKDEVLKNKAIKVLGNEKKLNENANLIIDSNLFCDSKGKTSLMMCSVNTEMKVEKQTSIIPEAGVNKLYNEGLISATKENLECKDMSKETSEERTMKSCEENIPFGLVNELEYEKEEKLEWSELPEVKVFSPVEELKNKEYLNGRNCVRQKEEYFETVPENCETVVKKKIESSDSKTIKGIGSLPETNEMRKYQIGFGGSKQISVNVPIKVNKSKKPKSSLRRSISMQFHQKCRTNYAIYRTLSEKNLKFSGIDDHSKPLGAPTKPACNVSETSAHSTVPNSPADDSDKENATPSMVMQQVNETDVENWLKELHALILKSKYPAERCEEWLAAIRRKCATCTQIPIYWECMVALDESRGDVKSAIEHYEKAISEGKNVDSLAQLFDKMVIDQQKPSKHKPVKGLDPKNVFKSTTIKFVLQQKTFKESDPKAESGDPQQLYVATPVRRSSRIQTTYKPHVVSSLQFLTPEVRKNMTFKPNETLLNED